MQIEKVRAEVRQIIAEVLALEEGVVAASERLQDLPGVESIKVLRIITKVEARYGIELDEQVVFNVGTLEDLVQQIVTQVGEGSALRAAV